jgi:hypothetical protein
VILNTMYHGIHREKKPHFYLYLGINSFFLNNCMLDSRPSENVMSLKVMKQLGLWTTHPYGKFCGIDSKKVKVYSLIEHVEVYMQSFPHVVT